MKPYRSRTPAPYITSALSSSLSAVWCHLDLIAIFRNLAVSSSKEELSTFLITGHYIIAPLQKEDGARRGALTSLERHPQSTQFDPRLE